MVPHISSLEGGNDGARLGDVLWPLSMFNRYFGTVQVREGIRGGKAEAIGLRKFNLQLSAGIGISVGVVPTIDVAS